MNNFIKWIDTFLSEKGIDLDEYFDVDGPSGVNSMPYQAVVDMMKVAPPHEQNSIKAVLVKIDFRNGDVKDFLRHLGKAIAR